MSARLTYLLPLALLVVLGIFLYAGLGLNPRLVPSPLINQPMPQFSLPSLEDPEQIISNANLEGPALINVWASWCVTCRQEHPVLVAMARQHGIPVYGLNYKDGRDDALRYLRSGGNPYVWIASDEAGRLGIDLGVYATPETFVIDAQGTIRHKHTGAITWDDARNDILPLIERLRREAS